MSTEPQPLIAQAVGHHQAGRLQEAEALYRAILVAEPRHADALHLLGLIAHQVGRNDLAAELIGQAIAVNPAYAAYQASLGLALASLGRGEDALAAYDAAIDLQADSPDIISNRGNVLRALGRQTEAAEAYCAALAIRPDFAQAHYNLGVALAELGRHEETVAAFEAAARLGLDLAEGRFLQGNALTALGRREEAVAAYDAAIRIQPDLADAHSNRGVVLTELGRPEEALLAYDAVARLRPDSADNYTNRGGALFDLGRLEASLADHDAAIRLRPDFALAHYNRGNTLRRMDRPKEALAAYDAALAIKPDDAMARSNRGVALQDMGLLEHAMAAYGEALQVAPDHAEAHYNEAFIHFLEGRFELGWPKYEWRWRRSQGARTFAQPQWRGEDPRGRTILLHAEQGLGDTIQFCRYAALVADRGARVVVEVQRPLVRLLAGLKGVERLVAAGEALPAFDLHCPLMSLPGVFGTTLETAPADIPYLEPEPELVRRWRARIGEGGFRIGVAWQGNPEAQAEKGRSAPLAAFAPLARIPGVRLISLQKVHGLDQLAGLPPGMTLETLGDDFDSGPDAFVDTAAVMESLDLVVTVDTATGHLAGALGRPTWLPLQKIPHWIWTLRGETTPWYPRHRLFRQTERGDWGPVFARMAEALAAEGVG